MKTSLGVEFAENPVHKRPSRSRRLTRLSALALAAVWFGAVTSALAASFGAGAIVEIIQPAQPTNVVFVASDPAGLITGVQRLLIPEGEAYTAGNTSASISLSRSTTGLTGIGTGIASADLATGAIRLSSTASGDAITVSAAGFSDILTPTASGYLYFHIAVTGVATGDALGSGVWYSINGGVFGARGEVNADGCFSTLNGANSCDYFFDVPVTAGVPFQVALAIEADANNSSLDLMNTATLRVTGVAYTSDSGVFLTAVPEPSAMLVLGFAWAAGYTWRSRRKAA